MSLSKRTTTSMKNYSDSLRELKHRIDMADAILVGAGSGLSAAAGFIYSGIRFTNNFSDFVSKYGFRDMYSAGFYPYDTLEEFWAYWSRYIFINRYDQPAGQPYDDLLSILEGKDFFVLTTNVDHRFQVAGVDKRRLFYTQGDFGLWQCSVPCHSKTYDNEEVVRRMVAEQSNMRIPSHLVPYCPVCGRPMSMNLRSDNTFVEDEGWHDASKRYESFIREHADSHILYLELGVGGNTPGIIKYSFWRFAYVNPDATYVCINLGESYAPKEIEGRSICIDAGIKEVLAELKASK